MHNAIKFAFISILLVILMGISIDLSQCRAIKKDLKDTLDVSTKAAALQLDTDSVKIGQGNDYIIDTTVINVHSKYDYIDKRGYKRTIEDPTIICNVKYPYKGIFINMDINVDILSGSSIINANELNN